jgi:hypothetical protein
MTGGYFKIELYNFVCSVMMIVCQFPKFSYSYILIVVARSSYISSDILLIVDWLVEYTDMVQQIRLYLGSVKCTP